jgi:hypothetical protein
VSAKKPDKIPRFANTQEFIKSLARVQQRETDKTRNDQSFKASIATGYAGGDPTVLLPGEASASADTKRSVVSIGWTLPRASDEIEVDPLGNDMAIAGIIKTLGVGSRTTGAYHLLPSFRIPESTGTYVNDLANHIRVQRLFIPGPLLVATVHVEVVATSAGALASVGIYSAEGGNLLVDSGTFNCTAAGIKSNTLGAAVDLGPGWYYFAFTLTDTTATLRAETSGTNIQTVFNGGTIQRGQAANSATSGVLPATLGAISDVSYTNTPLAKLQAA